jgi:hypothetical protein
MEFGDWEEEMVEDDEKKAEYTGVFKSLCIREPSYIWSATFLFSFPRGIISMLSHHASHPTPLHVSTSALHSPGLTSLFSA